MHDDGLRFFPGADGEGRESAARQISDINPAGIGQHDGVVIHLLERLHPPVRQGGKEIVEVPQLCRGAFVARRPKKRAACSEPQMPRSRAYCPVRPQPAPGLTGTPWAMPLIS